MRKKIILIITTILSWVIVIIPAILLLNQCINSYINGTTHGFNSEEYLYGIPAFFDTFSAIVLFLSPLVILWFILFIFAIIITIVTIMCYRENK